MYCEAENDAVLWSWKWCCLLSMQSASTHWSRIWRKAHASAICGYRQCDQLSGSFSINMVCTIVHLLPWRVGGGLKRKAGLRIHISNIVYTCMSSKLIASWLAYSSLFCRSTISSALNLSYFQSLGVLGCLLVCRVKLERRLFTVCGRVGRHAGRYGESENDAVYHMLTIQMST